LRGADAAWGFQENSGCRTFRQGREAGQRGGGHERTIERQALAEMSPLMRCISSARNWRASLIQFWVSMGVMMIPFFMHAAQHRMPAM
jgi:hypothetical protein